MSALVAAFPFATIGAEPAPQFDVKTAERFANLALACVGKEYPNKISHLLNSDADVAPPRKLVPGRKRRPNTVSGWKTVGLLHNR